MTNQADFNALMSDSEDESVKAKPVNTDLANAIKSILSEYFQLTDIDLEKKLRTKKGLQTTPSERWACIKETPFLVNNIQPQTDYENRMVYLWKDEIMLMADSQQLDTIEREMFKIIHAATTKGMKGNWVKSRLNITARDCKRALKRLEDCGLISKQTLGKKILYHRSDMELDESLTGGFWENDNMKPDTEAINIARKLAAQCLADRLAEKQRTSSILPGLQPPGFYSGCTTDEIKEYITSKNVFHAKLSDNDIKKLMETMRFDDLVNKHEKRDKIIYYLTKNSYPNTQGYGHCPCSTCPVKDVCGENSAVNPKSCEYLTQWLDDF